MKKLYVITERNKKDNSEQEIRAYRNARVAKEYFAQNVLNHYLKLSQESVLTKINLDATLNYPYDIFSDTTQPDYSYSDADYEIALTTLYTKNKLYIKFDN